MYCKKHSTEAAEFRAALTEAYQRFNALQRGEKRCFGVTMSQCLTLELLYQNDHLMARDLAYFIGNPYSRLPGPQVSPQPIPL